MNGFIVVVITITVSILILIILTIFIRINRVSGEEEFYCPCASLRTSTASEDHISTIYSAQMQREMDDQLPDYHEIIIDDLPSYHEVMNGYRYDNNSGVVR
ncbi:hypothetical protein PVAND_005375 [Polypedilum vanderplanki]|uniref:Uncharacterized protein n=1 Tax=Polypedilum vanderplanki TaxID=319348 RepID=A0A9J6C0E0_POLVA|nr:hypothetical protein PVAND_005375 [Polypedilum vanderplanki]